MQSGESNSEAYLWAMALAACILSGMAIGSWATFVVMVASR